MLSDNSGGVSSILPDDQQNLIETFYIEQDCDDQETHGDAYNEQDMEYNESGEDMIPDEDTSDITSQMLHNLIDETLLRSETRSYSQKIASLNRKKKELGRDKGVTHGCCSKTLELISNMNALTKKYMKTCDRMKQHIMKEKTDREEERKAHRRTNELLEQILIALNKK